MIICRQLLFFAIDQELISLRALAFDLTQIRGDRGFLIYEVS